MMVEAIATAATAIAIHVVTAYGSVGAETVSEGPTRKGSAVLGYSKEYERPVSWGTQLRGQNDSKSDRSLHRPRRVHR